MSDKFIWRAGDLVVYPLSTVSVVIDGDPRPWYNAAWSPDSGLDVALIFDRALSGAPTFNPNGPGPTSEPSVEEIMLRDVAQTGIMFTRLDPVPDGIATALTLTGDAEATIPLTDHDNHPDEASSAELDIELVYEDLNPAEIRFLGTFMGRLRQLRPMILGTYAESVVAVALDGCVHSPGGTDRHDLTWNGVRVEVKTTSGRSWQLEKARGRLPDGTKVEQLWADAYVLGHHQGKGHRDGWSFYVVPRAWLDARPTKSIPVRQMKDWGLQPTEPNDLATAILAAQDAGPRP